ncbi:MAG TPA: glycoside hydrolase family 3 C-terminal domain-containing protein [Candidatus Margulisiibacteriota bacterium]|nr:glycoside hydrolase family 3 C-terminal domain-containing protein [Candidatus Margulisiibacteriota bacterium]
MQARRAFLLLLVLSTLAACGDDDTVVPGGPVYRNPAAPVEARVQDLLSRMTLDEKIAQMHGVPITDTHNINGTPANTRLGIPGFHMVDGMRGVSVTTGPATAFPVGSARGATFDPDLEARVGEAIGAEARAKGYDVLLAPTINLLRHPRWGRAQETYGEDQVHMGAMAAGFIRGVQQHMIASAKHLALNSIEDTRMRVNVSVDERTLREIYLPHFKRAVDAGVGSIMCAYPKVNGVYACQNTHLLHDILLGEWGFDGFVESDWLFATHSTVPSAFAGLDIEMPYPHFYGQPLLDAVNGGSVPIDVIDAAVQRILRAKFRFGIFDGKPPLDPATVVESPAHTTLALEVERRAIVLLKNDGAALPLSRTSLHRVAVVGGLADTVNLGDTGSSDARSSYAITPLAGIQKHAGPVEVVDLSRNTLSADDVAQISAADAAVVVVGLTSADEGEGQQATPGIGDRKTLDLSTDQQQLILDVARHNPRTIVMLEGGSAIIVEPFVDQVAAILMAWYPGTEGGNAIAEVLFGDVNPSGKLDVTVPRSADQLPPFVNDQINVEYGYYHGYRYVDKNGLEPRYPFGFGLSYTTFAFSNLRLAASTIAPNGELRANVDVKNTGAVSGEEVVQLYVGYEGSRVDRAVRDLKAFQRVTLAPGQTKTVALAVPAADLGFWDVGANTFVVEPISYVIEVGSSSRDLPLDASVSIAAP